MKKILINHSTKVSRWLSVFSLATIIFVKIIENTSNNLYSMILDTPELLEYTSVTNSIFFFFV